MKSRGTLARLALVALCSLAASGCYQKVVGTSGAQSGIREIHEPDRAEDEPDWLDELMWGPPPAGTDAKEYYRSKRLLQGSPPSTAAGGQ